MTKGAGGVAGVEVRDTDAFRALCRRAIPEVYSYVVARCGGDTVLAEDITADAVLAAVDLYQRGATHDVTVGWFITVARRRLVDHWRREARESRRLRLAWAAQRERDEEALAWQGEQSRDHALRVLAALPADHQAVLCLRYFDELSVAEVAATIGRSLRATESLLARARRAFRDHYAEHDDD